MFKKETIYKKMESFYVTLPCDFKKKDEGYYRTELAQTVNLTGNWVVGLSEISFQKTWLNIKSNQQISLLYFDPDNKYGVGKSQIEKAFIKIGNYTKSS